MRLAVLAVVMVLSLVGCSSEAPPPAQTAPTVSEIPTTSTSPANLTVPTVLTHMGFNGPQASGDDWMQWRRQESDGSTSNITTKLSDNQATVRYAGYSSPARRPINTTTGPRTWQFFFCSINILALKSDEEMTKRVIMQALDDMNRIRLKFEQDPSLKVGPKGTNGAYDLSDYPHCYSYL